MIFFIGYKAGKENQGVDALSIVLLAVTTFTCSCIPLFQKELRQIKPINDFSPS